MSKIFNERLNMLKNENHLSVTEMAKKLENKVSPTGLNNYLRDREPRYDLLIKISQVFDVSVEWLLGISDVRKPSHERENSEIEHELSLSPDRCLSGSYLDEFSQLKTIIKKSELYIYKILQYNQEHGIYSNDFLYELICTLNLSSGFYSEVTDTLDRCSNTEPLNMHKVEKFISQAQSVSNKLYTSYKRLIDKFAVYLLKMAEQNPSLSPMEHAELRTLINFINSTHRNEE